jgi:4a-hydroxytetrahydrobiopterin dehydratase
MTLLSESEIHKHLSNLEGWKLKGNEITKTYNHTDFIDSISFVSRVAILAEKANHHPDILIQYNKVTLTLSTHREGGLTENDFNLAKKIDRG